MALNRRAEEWIAPNRTDQKFSVVKAVPVADTGSSGNDLTPAYCSSTTEPPTAPIVDVRKKRWPRKGRAVAAGRWWLVVDQRERLTLGGLTHAAHRCIPHASCSRRITSRAGRLRRRAGRGQTGRKFGVLVIQEGVTSILRDEGRWRCIGDDGRR